MTVQLTGLQYNIRNRNCHIAVDTENAMSGVSFWHFIKFYICAKFFLTKRAKLKLKNQSTAKCVYGTFK
jgi:hypothetical protein